MRNPLLTALLAVTLVLCGCSTTPTSPANRVPVPSSKIFSKELLERSDERTDAVTITRDSGILGSAVRVDVFLDGQRVSSLGVRETVTVFLASGDHIIGAKFAWGVAVSPVERDFVLRKGTSRSFRVFTDQDGNLDVRAELGKLQ